MSVPRSSFAHLAAPTVWEDGREPTWYRPTAQALEELLRLPENWNSYGASRIAPELAQAALRLLVATAASDTPPPTVVPTTSGGVLFERHTRGIDLEVEALAADRFHVFYEDAKSGQAWEDDVTSDISALVEMLAKLSGRGA